MGLKRNVKKSLSITYCKYIFLKKEEKGTPDSLECESGVFLSGDLICCFQFLLSAFSIFLPGKFSKMMHTDKYVNNRKS